MEESSTYIILLVINTFLYCICFYLIYKKRRYTCITVRSPALLFFNNIGGFITTTIILLTLLLERNDSFAYIPAAFFISQSLMMVSFLLRCHRIITCCKISEDEQNSLKKFAENKLMYQEKFYMRILVASMFIILIVVVVVDIIMKHTFTINFLIKTKYITSQANIWLILNFLEQLAMITYGYLMLVNEVKHKIKFELFGILICWFIYSNAMTFFDYYVYIKDKTITSNNDEIIILSITLAAFYISLFFNGYFPIILFFSYKTSVGYHFEPKLTTNLYLFLANEHCYGAFNDFLKYSQQKNDVFYLKLYTSIMKYKLMYIAHEPEGEIVDEGKKINDTYFKETISSYDEPFMKIAQDISQSSAIKNETFDPALKYAYDYLSNKFLDFKRLPDFKVLIDKLSLNSYIQCKMNNVGLVNKF